jgi:zinc-ribbon family
MIIWGSRGREKVLGSGQFYCPQCNTTRSYKHKRLAKYFTLYFIPLFQTEDLGEYVQCDHCKQTYKPEVLTYKPLSPAEQLLLGVRRQLEAGMPVHMLHKKLTAGGLEEAEAAQIVDIATDGKQKTCARCGFAYLDTVTTCANCGEPLASA